MVDFFPQAPMLPYYKYSGQGNLFTPRGYAQGTLVDLLMSRKPSDVEDAVTEATAPTEPAFEEVQDSDKQSFFNGMDLNEGAILDYDSLSDLSLADGLFGGTTVSANSPRGWTTQDQKEFDSLVASGLKPKAKWTGSSWYVYANELDGTPFGEPGTMSLADSFTSGGKYGGSPISLVGKIGGIVSGSYNPEDVFNKNLAQALSDNPGAATGGIQGDFSSILGTFEQKEKLPTVSEAEDIINNTSFLEIINDPNKKAQVQAANKVLRVQASAGGTVTAKEGGNVKAEETPKPKTQKQKRAELRKSIEAAVAAAKKAKEKADNDERSAREQQERDNREREKKNRETVREKQKAVKGFSGGYGF